MQADFPSRRFTLDGKLVGDIGELLAQELYDLKLYEENEPLHDGITPEGRRVQIKTTMKEALNIREVPDYYLGIRVNEKGDVEELFNGPGQILFDKVGHWKLSKNGTRNLRLSVLRTANELVPPEQRIKRRPPESAFDPLQPSHTQAPVSPG
jgi:hypothetical protein